MASTGQKWLIGCGIGCGAVILIIVLLVGTGVFFARKAMTGFKAVEAVSEQLETEYGSVESYCPPADGGISSDRIERFLSVRDSLLIISSEMEDRITSLSEHVNRLENNETKSFKEVLGFVTKGAGIIPQLADYYYRRNSALLKHQIAPGEYLYLYFIIYYGDLGHDPGDGPPFPIQNHKYRHRSLNWDTGKSHDLTEAEIIENRRSWITSRVHDLMLPMLECQMGSLEKSGHADAGWKRALAREIRALRSDPDRLPWQDGLPPALSANLPSYQEALEAHYVPILNVLEIMTNPDGD